MNDTPARKRAPLIQVRGMTKEYNSGSEVIHILKGVDLDVMPGEMIAIMGPSGMGKSTFLFILGLLHPPTSGSYWVLGEDVLTRDRGSQAEFRRNFAGFVFQSCNLFEHTTVYENLEYPLIYAGVKRKERPGMIHEALDKVNLGHRIHHPANRLSGGEQQRVSIARALVNRPRVIFADEPTGQLDRKHGDMVLDHFHEFISGKETAMVLVTHDPEIAKRCTRVCHLRDGNLYSE
jgi:putative ABC transport system ATP-binding protein